MNATSRFRPWHGSIAVPVLLFGMLMMLPADTDAAAPPQSTPALLRDATSAKKAADKRAADKKASSKSAKGKKSSLGKAVKKHHKKKHKKHHKKNNQKSKNNGSKAGMETRVNQDIARLQRDEKTLDRDTNRLRKALK